MVVDAKLNGIKKDIEDLIIKLVKKACDINEKDEVNINNVVLFRIVINHLLKAKEENDPKMKEDDVYFINIRSYSYDLVAAESKDLPKNVSFKFSLRILRSRSDIDGTDIDFGASLLIDKDKKLLKINEIDEPISFVNNLTKYICDFNKLKLKIKLSDNLLNLISNEFYRKFLAQSISKYLMTNYEDYTNTLSSLFNEKNKFKYSGYKHIITEEFFENASITGTITDETNNVTYDYSLDFNVNSEKRISIINITDASGNTKPIGGVNLLLKDFDKYF
jgi:hypothetical protein